MSRNATFRLRLTAEQRAELDRRARAARFRSASAWALATLLSDSNSPDGQPFRQPRSTPGETMAITDRQIRTLRIEAETAGDLDQSALCVLALGGPEALEGADPGTAQAELLDRGTTQDEARAECERVIVDAAQD